MGTMPPGPDGTPMDPLSSPAVRRNMIMMIARQNSQYLNTHISLQKAAKEGNIDGRYFQESLKFRMKTSLLLEACLRVAASKGSVKLVRTIVNTVAGYKIGVGDALDKKMISWFKGAVQAQYGQGNIPGVKIGDIKIETEDEDEVATGDTVTVSMRMERVHAEAFTKQKVELCRKQGLDPNVELRKYREGWWVIVSGRIKDTKEEPRLVLLQPVVVNNIDRKIVEFKAKFKAPPKAGMWEFTVDVMSQEFLGCDVKVVKYVDIVNEGELKKEGSYVTKDEEKRGKEESSSEDEEDGDAVVVNSPRNKQKERGGELRKRNVRVEMDTE
jgi:hypothetical protein